MRTLAGTGARAGASTAARDVILAAQPVRASNTDRPHQGIGQAVPERVAHGQEAPYSPGTVAVTPILGGLHHSYRRAA